MKQLIKSILPKRVIEKYRAHRKKKNSSLIQGNDVECPICNSSFKLFGEFGANNRPNAECHNCGSLERHRLIYLFMSKSLQIFDSTISDYKLLHIAPEEVFYDKFDTNQRISYVPCDLYPELYVYGGETKIKKVDITSIPFEDGSFDFILCNHVLEHIPDDHLAMSELFRVLTDGGSGIFQVPIDYSRQQTYEDWSITSPEERVKAFGQKDHVRWYGQDYKDRLKKVGFTVDEIDIRSLFSSDEIFKYGLMESEKIYYCKK